MSAPVAARRAGEPTGPGPGWLADLAHAGLALLLALVLGSVSLSSALDGGLATGWLAAVLAALGVLHLAIALAHRWSRAVFAAGAVAMALLVAAPDLTGGTARAAGTEYAPVLLPSSLCFFVLLYAVAAHAPPPWPAAGLAVGLAGSAVTLLRLHDLGSAVLAGLPAWAWLLLLTTAMVAGCIAAWGLGRFRAVRRAWVAALAEQGAAEERRRIAREMHDVVAHSLAVVVGQAEGGGMLVTAAPERAPEVLEQIADVGRRALAEMRGLLGVLRDDEASSAPQPGLVDLPDLLERVRSSGLEVRVVGDDAEPRGVSAVTQLTAYRLIQEALTNASRHAGSSAVVDVEVRVEAGDLLVRVSDDGRSTRPTDGAGRGLIGMRERVEAVGGRVAAGPRPDGRGWLVRARMPR